MSTHDQFNELRRRSGLQEADTPADGLVKHAEQLMSPNFSAWVAKAGPYQVTLDDLKADPRGQGHGTKFMTELTKRADMLGVHLWLEVSEEDEERLINWYSRFGFQLAPGGRMGNVSMERRPR